MANRKLLPLIVCGLLGGTSLVMAQGTGQGAPGTPAQNSTMEHGSQPFGPNTGAQPGQSMQHGDRMQRNEIREPANRHSGANRTERMDKSGAEQGSNGKAVTRNRDKAGEGKAGRNNAETTSPRSHTTGQATAGPRLTQEQRTTIRSSVQSVQPATNINFSVAVGTRVPREMTFHPLPVEIVTIYPRWRGYEFFRVGDEVVVVNPRTMEIVAVLDV